MQSETREDVRDRYKLLIGTSVLVKIKNILDEKKASAAVRELANEIGEGFLIELLENRIEVSIDDLDNVAIQILKARAIIIDGELERGLNVPMGKKLMFVVRHARRLQAYKEFKKLVEDL